MLTHLGAGAGQGLEDAYLIAKLLSHAETTTENIEVFTVRPCHSIIANIFYLRRRY